MSLPSFPTPVPPIDREDAINSIIVSIAMEEIGLSHIINAEGEKLQFVLGTLSGITGPAATIDDVLAVNESVKDTLSSIMQNQMLLTAKLQSVLNASCPTGVTGG